MTRARDLADSADKDIAGTVTLDDIILSNDITLADNGKAIFGAGSDLQIYHDGSNSFIEEAGTGNLIVAGSNEVKIRPTPLGSNLAVFKSGSVDLYASGTKRLETTATGISVTGNATFADNGKAIFGAGSDLEVFHDGSASNIIDTGTGNLFICGSGAIHLMNPAQTEYYASFNDNGAVDLRYDNAIKLATTSTGISVTGRAVTDGVTVDGYLDFQTDGTFPTTGLLLHTNNYFYLRGGSNGTIFGDPSGNEYLRFEGSQVVVNNEGADRDFRVESDTNTHMLFVDAGSNHVNIGGSTDLSQVLNVHGGVALGTDPTVTWNSNYIKFQTRSGSVPVVELLASAIGNYAPRLDIMDGSGATQHSINGAGDTTFNETGANFDFRVESDTNTHALFVDAGNNQVLVGTNTPITGIGAAMTIGGLNDTRLAIDGTNSSGLYLTDSGAQGITIRNASGDLEFYGIATREFVFNEYGADTDFRVESDSNANMFVVNAGTNSVGIGVDPASKGSVLVTEGGSSLFGAELSTDGEAYALSSSSKVQYSPAGTAARVYNRSTSTPGTGALIDFLAYGGTNGTVAQNVFMGAVSTSSGTANTANLVFGRRTGTTAWSEMARFDPNGTFLHGNTAHSWTSNSTALFNSGGIGVTSNSDWSLQLAGSTTQRIRFFTSNGGSGATVGSVSVSASSTSYNTSSDHRLKENVVDLTGATERVKQLAPKRFNFIVDADTTVDGFLAHEVQSVVPEAITGTHNEVDDDGNPVYQGIDQSKLVPLLVATIKELEARITALENA